MPSQKIPKIDPDSCPACACSTLSIESGQAYICGVISRDALGMERIAAKLCDSHAILALTYYEVMTASAKYTEEEMKKLEEQMEEAVVTVRVPDKDMN